MLVKGLGSLLVLAVGTFLLGMAEFVIEGILPDLARDLNISIPMAGHAISIYALGVCVGATFLIVLHKLRPKHILLGLVSLVFIGALLSVTAQSYVWLLAARFISGLPHGAYYGVGTIVAYRLADESHKTRAVAIMCAGMTFANLLGNPVATLLSGTLSWRLAFAVIAVGSVVDLLLVARFVPNLDPPSRLGLQGTVPLSAPSRPVAHYPCHDVWQRRHPGLVQLHIAGTGRRGRIVGLAAAALHGLGRLGHGHRQPPERLDVG